jgi:hypothetical protein
MKDKTILLRFSEEQLKIIINAYKNRLINGDYISRSEFIRITLLVALNVGGK